MEFAYRRLSDESRNVESPLDLVFQVVHEAGSMIIVFPHAYHSGFNHGFVILTYGEQSEYQSTQVQYGRVD